MAIEDPERPRGILNQTIGETKFQLSRRLPAQDLSFFVQRYWMVTWDLRGQTPHRQETLPFPCVNLTIEPDRALIVGVVSGKFSVLLEDQGRVFGVKFRPGAFYPFIKSSVAKLTNVTLSVADVFGADSAALHADCAQADQDALIERAETFLRARLPERDEQVELINQIVDYIIADRAITRVDALVDQFHLTKRTLQRLFSQYVGVSPKWVIMRYRLQEAAEQMSDGDVLDWPRLALELGYFDQAHFIKDFKTIVGRTPAEYARSL